MTLYRFLSIPQDFTRRMVQSIRLFLLIVPEKTGKITQVATFESVPTISGGLYLSLLNILLFNEFLLNLMANKGDIHNG